LKVCFNKKKLFLKIKILERGHGLIIKPKIVASEWYAILTAFIAALLVFILLFVETEITE
jgi:hypothetical protein